MPSPAILHIAVMSSSICSYGLGLAFSQQRRVASRSISFALYDSLNVPSLVGVEHRPLSEKQQMLYDIDQYLDFHGSLSQNNIETLMQKIDQSHFDDSQFCSVFEQEQNVLDDVSNGEEIRQIHSSTVPPTLQSPLLLFNEVEVIRSAAQSYWSRPQANAYSSRFTYQRKGNYEAHLVDLAYHNPSIVDIMNESLQKHIYPLVRSEFQDKIIDLANHKLCIYDALVIRYNATEAMLELDGTGAGQPLHRDLGLVSVNIMLNHPSEFEGGGTFFENQLLPFISDISFDKHLPTVRPLKPLDVGHALLHLSSERHAGALTTKGVREILVIFITARKEAKSGINENQEKTLPSAPVMERSARLKSSARTYCSDSPSVAQSILCRILHYRLALEYNAIDGEAWHYLGMSLREIYKAQFNDPITLQMAVLCLRYAIFLIPCDGRLFNNFALALETLNEYYQENQIKISSDVAVSLHDQIVTGYERSILLHDLSARAGCDVATDYDSACLNYGLYLSKLDLFDKSVKILKRRFTAHDDLNKTGNCSDDHKTVRQHGQSLLEFCSKLSLLT